MSERAEEVVPGEIAPIDENATAYRIFEEAAKYDPDMDFRRMALDAAFASQGFRLVSKDQLQGVPFVVKRVTYRPGFPREGVIGDYVSVECVVASRDLLDTPPVQSQLAGPLAVYPNEPVIFNDSGTGIRRTLTYGFERASLINTGPATREDENTLDRQFQRWQAGAEGAQYGFDAREHFGKGAIYLAIRGLRRSDYESPFGPATTWYFA